MANGTVILCGHCNRPIIEGVGVSVIGGDGRFYHYECARSPYANISDTYQPIGIGKVNNHGTT